MFKTARAAIIAATLAFAPGLHAAEAPNLLVMGEDSDLDTIQRHTQVFDRVTEAISGELRARGFAVYDETAVTMEFYDLSRVRRSDAELISLAKTVQIVPVDAVASFQIHVSVKDSPYEGIQDLRLRVSGRVVNVHTGLSLGGYEVSYQPGDLPPLPLNCRRPCLVGFVGDQAAPIARDVGAALAAQLAGVEPAHARAPRPNNGCDGASNTFTLTFKDFSPEEMARVDPVLSAFHGYVHHQRLDPDNPQSAYGYETCADTARLARNLRAMFEQSGTTVWIESEGQEVFIAKIAAPASQ